MNKIEKKSYKEMKCKVGELFKYKAPIPIVLSTGERHHSMEEHGKPIIIKTKKKKGETK